LPHKRRQVRATTGYRYAWFVEHYISSNIGHVPLRRLRADHLDDLYEHLATTGGRHRTLGHAHPAFTIHTYQHLLPGMSAAAIHIS
jgi:hypothetical protein